MKMEGIIPALVTPFDGDGNVNYGELRKLVKTLLGEGADGFYVTGSTGQCFLLEDEERIRIVAEVAETVGGRVPVIAHVGKIGTAQAKHLAKEAQRAGADAVSSVPPFYYNFSFGEIVDYYGAISDAVELPIVLYNFPQCSGVTIRADNLGEIRGRCRIEGLKYTDLDLYELERIRRSNPDLCLMFGKDEAFLYALPVGVDGGIGSTYNVMLGKFKRILSAYREGRTGEAEQLQHEACHIIEEMLRVGNIILAEKYLLARKGIVCGNCRQPFGAITEAQKQILDKIGDLD